MADIEKEFEKVIPDTDSKLGPVVYQKNENCQVFNGAMSGCVFAMPGAHVDNHPTQEVHSDMKPQAGGTREMPDHGRMAPITGEMVRVAALKAMDLRDEKGKRLFAFVYYWQSIHRILCDEGFCNEMTETCTLIQNLFPGTGLPADCGKFYLKDVSNFSKYNVGDYAGPFSSWKKLDRFGSPDPRYLVAEAFKNELDRLRREEWHKENVKR